MGVFDKITVLSFTQNILAEHFMGREEWSIINVFVLFLSVLQKLAEVKMILRTSLTNLHL